MTIKTVSGKPAPKQATAPLSDFDATMIAEGVQEPVSDAQYIQAWQHLVDTGLAWTLQGWFGRRAKQLIDAGVINP